MLPIILPILDGLYALHSTGFIHRDIKPGNIYMRKHDTTPVLLDFGAARQTMGIATQTLTTILTPDYAPMEQYYTSSKQQGPWTDIYSIAAVLYCMITGRPPAHAPDRSSSIMRKETDPTHHLNRLAGSKYSPDFLAALEHALQVLAHDRPRNVMEFREELLGKTEQHETPEPSVELTQTHLVEHSQTNEISVNESRPALTVYGTTMPSISHISEQNDSRRESPTQNPIQTRSVSKSYHLLMIANVAFMVFLAVEKIQQIGKLVPVLIVYSGLVNVFPILWFGVDLLIWKIYAYLKKKNKPRPTAWSFLKVTLMMEILGLGSILYFIYGR